MDSLETGVDGYPQAVAAWLGILAGEPVEHEDGMKRWRGMVGRWARHPAMRRKALLALLTPVLEKVEQAMLEWPRPVEARNPQWVNVWLQIREILAEDPELWHRGALLAQMADQGAWPPREAPPPPKVVPPEVKPVAAATAPSPSRKTDPIPRSVPLQGVEEVRSSPSAVKEPVQRPDTPSSTPARPGSPPPSPQAPGPSVEAQGGVARVGFPVRSMRRVVRGSDSPPPKHP